MPALSLSMTVRDSNGHEWTETMDALDLIDPSDVGKRRPRNPRVQVTNATDAETYCTALLQAFNDTRRNPKTPTRTLMAVVLKPRLESF